MGMLIEQYGEQSKMNSCNYLNIKGIQNKFDSSRAQNHPIFLEIHL